MGEDTWKPAQYERFRDERSRPFFDLVALVRPRPRMRVVDLGCGTGELTRALHERLSARETLGIDSSAAMLARCPRPEGVAREGVTELGFCQADIAEVAAEWDEGDDGAAAAPPPPPSRLRFAPPFDLIFSNAGLHWLPDHETLLARLTRALGPAGQLAVQIPANDDHPTHRVAREVAGEAPFRTALAGFTGRDPVHPPERYATWLNRLGYAEQHVRLTVYAHRLGSRDDVVEWVKGSLLTDYERRLGDLYPAFFARYRERLLPSLAEERPYFYPFKRILFWGERP